MLSKTALVTTLLVLTGPGVATNVHVNQGCILISGNPACAGNGKGSPVQINGGSAKIHARFSGNNDPFEENSGCILNAEWPQHYGDIYFGADIVFTNLKVKISTANAALPDKNMSATHTTTGTAKI